jgi:hypothetical protein
MINLIPPEGHKAVKREYILRVGATLAFLFGWAIIFLTVALVPTYVLINAQINAFELEDGGEGEKEDLFKKAQGEVNAIETVLAQLKTTAPTVSASVVIAEIQKRAPANIVFRRFSFVETKGVINTVQVQGVAPTRESLAQLKSALEVSEMFRSAEVPIADLARDAELPFVITVTVSPNYTK